MPVNVNIYAVRNQGISPLLVFNYDFLKNHCGYELNDYDVQLISKELPYRPHVEGITKDGGIVPFKSGGVRKLDFVVDGQCLFETVVNPYYYGAVLRFNHNLDNQYQLEQLFSENIINNSGTFIAKP